MSTYDQVVKAAQRLVTDDTRDTWGLSDAVLAHVPEVYGSGAEISTRGEVSVPDRLLALSKQLATDGVTTPNGDAYTPDSLRHLRDNAKGWNHNERFPEAAYRTHQEAGSPRTEGGKVLAALVAVKRGENPAKPRGIDAGAWGKAVTRVQTRTKGFPVAANDIRIALQRRPNVPGPSRGPVTKADIKDALDSGELDPQDVADVLPDDALVGTWVNRQNEHAPLTEGMSPEEITRSDQLIDALQSAVDGMQSMSKDITEGWWQHDIIHAQYDLVSVLRHIDADLDSEQVAFLTEHADEIRKVLDLIDMKARGSGLPDEVSNWLAAQAAS